MGELLSNIEENISGLRIIKAFDARKTHKNTLKKTAVDIAIS